MTEKKTKSKTVKVIQIAAASGMRGVWKVDGEHQVEALVCVALLSNGQVVGMTSEDGSIHPCESDKNFVDYLPKGMSLEDLELDEEDDEEDDDSDEDEDEDEEDDD